MKLLLDTNLLVLLVVGLTDRELILKHKRTRTFEPADYDLLLEILASVDTVVVTPHVLAEASNLLAQIGEPTLSTLRATFAALVEVQEEIYVAARESVRQPAFPRLGLTDTAILELVAEIDNSQLALLTTDVGLYLEAAKTNPLAENFNHIRQARLLGN